MFEKLIEKLEEYKKYQYINHPCKRYFDEGIDIAISLVLKHDNRRMVNAQEIIDKLKGILF